MSIETKINKIESKIACYNNMLRLISEKDAFNAAFVRMYLRSAEKKLGNLCEIKASI